MTEVAPDDVTDAEQTLFLRVYDQLRRLAHGYLRGACQTLQPTALVHEAYLRMAGHAGAPNDRNHFIAVAATAMRQILVDRARRRNADKRGGGQAAVTLDDATGLAQSAAGVVDLLALDQVMTALAALSQRQARIVELRCFGGLTVDEVAQVLAISSSLAEKEWRSAKAWIRRELARDA